MTHTLITLPYKYSDLEPHMDAKTVEIHYSKHHQGYVNNLNAAIEKHPELLNKTLEELLKNLDLIPEDIKTAVRNNAGGTYSHNLFWQILSPTADGLPTGEILPLPSRAVQVSAASVRGFAKGRRDKLRRRGRTSIAFSETVVSPSQSRYTPCSNGHPARPPPVCQTQQGICIPRIRRQSVCRMCCGAQYRSGCKIAGNHWNQRGSP